MLHEFSTVCFLLQFLENFSQLLRKERSHCVHTATFSYIYPIRTQSRQGIVRYILTVQIQSQSFFFKSSLHFFFKRSKSCKVHTQYVCMVLDVQYKYLYTLWCGRRPSRRNFYSNSTLHFTWVLAQHCPLFLLALVHSRQNKLIHQLPSPVRLAFIV